MRGTVAIMSHREDPCPILGRVFPRVGHSRCIVARQGHAPLLIQEAATLHRGFAPVCLPPEAPYQREGNLWGASTRTPTSQPRRRVRRTPWRAYAHEPGRHTSHAMCLLSGWGSRRWLWSSASINCGSLAASCPTTLRNTVKSVRSLVLAVALATPLLLVSPAAAHDGNHPFRNCTDARNNGYSNIPEGDRHYAPKLDRDGDGWGCDKHGTLANDGKVGTGHYADEAQEPADEPSAGGTDDAKGGDSLAETGGSSATPYLAAGGAVLLLGGGALALRRRRTN